MYTINITQNTVNKYHLISKKYDNFYDLYSNLIKKTISDFLIFKNGYKFPDSNLFNNYLDSSYNSWDNTLKIYIDVNQEIRTTELGEYNMRLQRHSAKIIIYIDRIIDSCRIFDPNINEKEHFEGVLLHELFHCYHNCCRKDKGKGWIMERYRGQVHKGRKNRRENGLPLIERIERRKFIVEGLASYFEYLYYSSANNTILANDLINLWNKNKDYLPEKIIYRLPEPKTQFGSVFKYDYYYSFAKYILNSKNDNIFYQIFIASITKFDEAYKKIDNRNL